MRRCLVAVALGLAALGLTVLTPARASARPPRVVVGVYSPGVTVGYGTYYAPAYYVPPPPPPVVVAPAPYAVAPPVVVAPAPAYAVAPVGVSATFVVRPRYYYRRW